MPVEADAAGDGTWYSYAVVRVVPHVEREEFLNAGVILFARTLNFLDVRIGIDEARLRALAPDIDLALVREHLKTFAAITAGDPAGGPIAGLSQSERFHWLTAPRSTIIQTSPIHVGRCEKPEKAIDELMREFVT